MALKRPNWRKLSTISEACFARKMIKLCFGPCYNVILAHVGVFVKSFMGLFNNLPSSGTPDNTNLNT